MSRKPMLSFRVEEELLDVLEGLADQHDKARSEVAREMLWRQLEAGGYEPSEVERVLAGRERAKQQNKVQQLRGGFRSRVLRDLKKRFENGWKPSEVSATKPGYVAEAEALWPDDDDAEERAVEVFEQVMEEYREAYATSSWDPFSDPFGAYTGVKDGKEQEAEKEQREAEEKLRNKARELLEGDVSRRKAESRLATMFSVSEAHAAEVLKQVQRDAAAVSQGVPSDD